ncbi:MAG: hypothetical protein IJ072_01755, partial [Oscillospiraceae bacterium]|nr:hypothetical protein [Oscillospiraceae bacterium]
MLPRFCIINVYVRVSPCATSEGNMDFAIVSRGSSVTVTVADAFDPDRVDEFIALGEAAEGYRSVERALVGVRESSPDIEYVYVYRIEPDGC